MHVKNAVHQLQPLRAGGTRFPTRSVVGARQTLVRSHTFGHRKFDGKGFGKKDASLGVPITFRMDDLPKSGEVLTDVERTCDPEERNCKTPMFVYEQKCPSCHGTGTTRTTRKHRLLGTCILCAGVGYTRHVTARFMPEVGEDPHAPKLMFRESKEAEPAEKRRHEYGDWESPHPDEGGTDPFADPKFDVPGADEVFRRKPTGAEQGAPAEQFGVHITGEPPESNGNGSGNGNGTGKAKGDGGRSVDGATEGDTERATAAR